MDLQKEDLNLMRETIKTYTKGFNSKHLQSTTWKLIPNKPSQFPYSTRNPYDDG